MATCLKCGNKDAYIGLQKVECPNANCTNFSEKQLADTIRVIAEAAAPSHACTEPAPTHAYYADIEAESDVEDDDDERVKTIMVHSWANGITYKGDVATFDDLPDDADVGDSYCVMKDGTVWRCTEPHVWHLFGTTIT
jgi:hypothetical protein